MTGAARRLPTVEAVAATRLALNEATFGWCLRKARRGLAGHAPETALRWSVLAAKSAIHHGFGRLVSPELEDTLLAVAARLPCPEAVPEPGASAPRWLHVLDRAHAIGGHSALVRRWIEANPNGGRHSVLLLSHRGSAPLPLVEETRATGGTVTALSTDAPLMERAGRLREEAWTRADRVVLHVHPWSVIPVVALGVPGGPPVMFLNHLGQQFWVGASIADLVVNLRDSSLAWSQAHRGVARNALLPIPIPPRRHDAHGATASEKRRAARSMLGVPAGAIVLLTIGSAFKYRPLPGLDFLKAAAGILDACPQAYVVAVGPGPDGRWLALRESSGQRLLTTGPQRDLTRFHEAADVYLEGFPLGSPTALLEVGLRGIPCVRAPGGAPAPLTADGIALAGVRQPVDVDEYVRTAIALVRSEDDRQARGSALAEAIEAHHTGSGWLGHAREAEGALPERHGVYPLGGAAPLAPRLRDLSVALSTLGHAEDTLTFTVRAAFEQGLSVRLDAPLAKALITRCLVADRRLLQRPWLLVALGESLAGRGLLKGLRRVRQRRAMRATARSEQARP
jgi:hypothetical protein